jgi:hypothetical protein
MRAPIRTLSLYAAFLGGTALVGACDTAVTSPVDRRAAEPEAILFFGSTWTRSDLPFAPAAINGAGVIVGTNGNEAVRWRNGVVDTLPHRAGLAGPYTAADITPNGLILGQANGHLLYWFADGTPPVDASANSSYAGSLWPVAMNDSYMIVALSYATLAPTSVRWTPSTGFVNIGLGAGVTGQDQTIVTSLNANGQAAGNYNRPGFPSQALRWGASSTPVFLPAPLNWQGFPSGNAVSIDGAGNIFGGTSAGATIWHPDGTTALVTGLPGQPSLRSDAGRFVGVGYNNGVQQLFTSYNGSLAWLSNPDAIVPTPVDVNNCGSIILKRATSPASGYLWRRTGIQYTCDTQLVLNSGLTMN